MTAEIAVMNKEAVALAADSAVTIGEGNKTFTSANKIFALSKYCPVGIMVYGGADLMGIPWEVLIKRYRSGLGKQRYKTLKEYADSFVIFLGERVDIIGKSDQEEYVRFTVYSYLTLLKDETLKEMEKRLLLKKRLSKKKYET